MIEKRTEPKSRLLPYPVFILLCPHGNTLRLSRFCWIKPLLVRNCKTGRTENKPFSHGERQEDKKGNSAYHSIPRPGHGHATLTHSSRYKSSVLNQLDTSIGFLKIKLYYLFFFSTTINNSQNGSLVATREHQRIPLPTKKAHGYTQHRLACRKRSEAHNNESSHKEISTRLKSRALGFCSGFSQANLSFISQNK